MTRGWRFELRSDHAPFLLRTAVEGHGWFDLAPHVWDRATQTLDTVLDAGGSGADVRVRPAAGDGVRVVVRAVGDAAGVRAELRGALRRMLRLDEDLEPFWRLCDTRESHRWVRARGVGRLLRGPTLFEDLLKVLFTTNCSWGLTRTMCTRVVEVCGAPAPSGRRAFPSAAACARLSEADWRDQVRAGYRAPHARWLADAFASGALQAAGFEDPDLPTDELRRRLLALRGFGPYAAGQVLRLLGHYDDLALDSWCRARGAQLAGRSRPPADAWFERRYRGFGRYRGLGLWTELTADWHMDAPRFDARAP
ncbi:MAG: Fe-S cluster assembly protein HesB [Planctomycetes bacterium]|nr:Fe-S cluster assembly protein HesB [Planctomycetota bacterium]